MAGKLKILLIILSSFILFRCSDEPTSIGRDLLGGDLIGILSMNSADDSIPQTSSYFHDAIPLGASGRLLLGKTADLEASLLVKFGITLIDTLKEDIINDRINVISSELLLVRTYSFGPTLIPFDFTVHKVTSDWSINFSEDSISGLNYETEDLSSEKDVNDSTTTCVLNNELLLEWLRIAADADLGKNNGIYLKPSDGTNKVLGYQAVTGSGVNVPFISVVIEKPGVYTDTVYFTAGLDVGIVQGNIPQLSQGNIPLRSGYVINSKLIFNLPEFSRYAVVNTAELILSIDTTETIVGSDYTNSLNAYFLFDSTNTDSISNAIALARSGNQFRGNITSFVREWIKGNNHGLLITTGSPSTGVELFAVKGSNVVSAADRPLLRITYSEMRQ